MAVVDNALYVDGHRTANPTDLEDSYRRHMPELQWTFGYPLAIALMLATSVTLYVVFKRRGWL